MVSKAALFALYFLQAKLRRFLFERSPAAYRRFQLAAALPRWRRFPFYRDLGAFASFPVINKARMLAEFPRLNRYGLSYEACLEAGLAQERSRDFLGAQGMPCAVGLSSGTSGRRGVFLTSERERLRWAATVLAGAPFLPLLRRSRVAFFLRSNSPLYEEGGGVFLKFRYFDLSRDFGSLYGEAVAFAPTVLVAPPPVLAMLLEREERARKLFPKAVVSVADKLPADLRERLAAFFRAPVHEVYQATEGFLGITCARGTLHLNEELFYLEKRAASGGAFEPVLSDYFRASQAFVRYHLDDVLVPRAVPCPCGSKRLALAEIRGRADDVLWLEGEGGREVALLPDFVRQLLQNELRADTDFLVVQEHPRRLEIQLPARPAEEQLLAVRTGLEALLRRHGALLPEIAWSFQLRRGPGEKRKRVARVVKEDTAPGR